MTTLSAAAQYRQLVQLGRDEFVAASAPAAFVRERAAAPAISAERTETLDDEETEATMPVQRLEPDDGPASDLELFPLLKKPGASFPDRITIGRTPNNDVVISDASVSRLHAYARRATNGWMIADAGSKNGSWLRGEALEARRERPLATRALVRLGEVDLTFYLAADLYAALGGR